MLIFNHLTNPQTKSLTLWILPIDSIHSSFCSWYCERILKLDKTTLPVCAVPPFMLKLINSGCSIFLQHLSAQFHPTVQQPTHSSCKKSYAFYFTSIFLFRLRVPFREPFVQPDRTSIPWLEAGKNKSVLPVDAGWAMKGSLAEARNSFIFLLTPFCFLLFEIKK